MDSLSSIQPAVLLPGMAPGAAAAGQGAVGPPFLDLLFASLLGSTPPAVGAGKQTVLAGESCPRPGAVALAGDSLPPGMAWQKAGAMGKPAGKPPWATEVVPSETPGRMPGVARSIGEAPAPIEPEKDDRTPGAGPQGEGAIGATQAVVLLVQGGIFPAQVPIPANRKDQVAAGQDQLPVGNVIVTAEHAQGAPDAVAPLDPMSVNLASPGLPAHPPPAARISSRSGVTEGPVEGGKTQEGAQAEATIPAGASAAAGAKAWVDVEARAAAGIRHPSEVPVPEGEAAESQAQAGHVDSRAPTRGEVKEAHGTAPGHEVPAMLADAGIDPLQPAADDPDPIRRAAQTEDHSEPAASVSARLSWGGTPAMGLHQEQRDATGPASNPAQRDFATIADVRAPASGDDGLAEAAGRQLVDRLVQAVRRGEGQCTLQLHPRELGRVQAEIAVSGGSVNLHLRVETVEAHQAIHGALPELRGALESHGMTVSHCDVGLAGGHTASGQWHGGNSGTGHGLAEPYTRAGNPHEPSPRPAPAAMPARRQGLLDLMI